MSYALRISHYILEKDPAVEYFIPFTKKALVSLLDGYYGDAIGEIFSLKKEKLKELLEKSDGTLATFLKRHNLFDLKDENGENYFVELLDKDNQGDVWIINDPEEPEENSLGDYLADAKLISDTVDTVGFLEFERYIEGSKSVSDINEEAENTMMFRAQFFLEKVIFSIIVTIDESDDWTTIEWPVPPKDFFEYINSLFPDKKINSYGENVGQNLDEIFGLVEDSLSEKIVDIKQFTESFLRLEVPDTSYSLYAASYDYIYKVFEILTGNRIDLLTDELVDYIDKIHGRIWDVSRCKPFWIIRLLKIRMEKHFITKDLLSINTNSFFIDFFPKGIKILENTKEIFEGPIKWCTDRINDEYKNIIKKYKKNASGCYVIAVTRDIDYIALSGLDYDGNIPTGEPLKSDTEKYNKIMSIVEKNILVRDTIHCNLNDLTKRYTKIIFKNKSDSKDCNKKHSIEYDTHYAYLKDDLKIKFKDKSENYGLTFGCCERKILGKILPEGQESCEQKIVFFSRWAPCEKCRPAIYLQQNSDYYAFADNYNKKVEYRLSRYFVEKKQNKKEYTLKKEELGKCVTSENKIYQIPREETDIRIYSDEYRIFKLYKNIYDNTLGKVKENNLGYSIQINSYLLEPKYRYIQIGIDEEKGISIFCDKKEEKAYIGLTYAFLSRRMVKNVYDRGIYYWGEKSTDDFLKEQLSNVVINKSDAFRELDNILEVDVNKLNTTCTFPYYDNIDKSIFLVFRQKSNVNKEEDETRNIVFNSTIKDIDISMCKYGTESLSKVEKVAFCINNNKDIIVKIIEACRLDKILNEIEIKRKPGSKIEKEKKKLRDNIEKTIYGSNGSEYEFDGIKVYILNQN